MSASHSPNSQLSSPRSPRSPPSPRSPSRPLKRADILPANVGQSGSIFKFHNYKKRYEKLGSQSSQSLKSESQSTASQPTNGTKKSARFALAEGVYKSSSTDDMLYADKLRDDLAARKMYALLCVLGIISGLVNGCLLWAVKQLSGGLIRILHFDNYTLWVNFVFFAAAAMSCAFMAALITKTFGPQASGSGLPEIKALLASDIGTKEISKKLVSPPILFAKFFGNILAAGSGLSVGSEGPMIMIAGCLAHVLMRYVDYFKTIYESETISNQVYAASAVVGVAASFNAPIGGLLFSVEVTSTFYFVSNYWKSFLASIVGAIMINVFYWAREDEMREVFLILELDPVLHPYAKWEYLVFIAMGFIFGFLSFCYLKLHQRFYHLTSYYKRNKPIAMTIMASLITSLLVIGSGAYLYKDLSVLSVLTDALVDGESTEMAGREDVPVYAGLAMTFLIRTFLTIMGTNCPVPAGTFMPTLLIGAIFGRLIGTFVRDMAGPEADNIYVEGYALVGAVAFCGGVTTTVSAAVVVVEITGQIHMLLPCLIGAVISSGITHSTSLSIYDQAMVNKGLQTFALLLLHSSENTMAVDLMDEEVYALHSHCTVGNLVKLCELTMALPESEFPVLEPFPSMKLMGAVSRKDIFNYLYEKFKIEDRLELLRVLLTHDVNARYRKLRKKRSTMSKRSRSMRNLMFRMPGRMDSMDMSMECLNNSNPSLNGSSDPSTPRRKMISSVLPRFLRQTSLDSEDGSYMDSTREGTPSNSRRPSIVKTNTHLQQLAIESKDWNAKPRTRRISWTGNEAGEAESKANEVKEGEWRSRDDDGRNDVGASTDPTRSHLLSGISLDDMQLQEEGKYLDKVHHALNYASSKNTLDSSHMAESQRSSSQFTLQAPDADDLACMDDVKQEENSNVMDDGSKNMKGSTPRTRKAQSDSPRPTQASKMQGKRSKSGRSLSTPVEAEANVLTDTDMKKSEGTTYTAGAKKTVSVAKEKNVELEIALGILPREGPKGSDGPPDSRSSGKDLRSPVRKRDPVISPRGSRMLVDDAGSASVSPSPRRKARPQSDRITRSQGSAKTKLKRHSDVLRKPYESKLDDERMHELELPANAAGVPIISITKGEYSNDGGELFRPSIGELGEDIPSMGGIGGREAEKLPSFDDTNADGPKRPGRFLSISTDTDLANPVIQVPDSPERAKSADHYRGSTWNDSQRVQELLADSTSRDKRDEELTRRRTASLEHFSFRKVSTESSKSASSGHSFAPLTQEALEAYNDRKNAEDDEEQNETAHALERRHSDTCMIGKDPKKAREEVSMFIQSSISEVLDDFHKEKIMEDEGMLVLRPRPMPRPALSHSQSQRAPSRSSGHFFNIKSLANVLSNNDDSESLKGVGGSGVGGSGIGGSPRSMISRDSLRFGRSSRRSSVDGGKSSELLTSEGTNAGSSPGSPKASRKARFVMGAESAGEESDFYETDGGEVTDGNDDDGDDDGDDDVYESGRGSSSTKGSNKRHFRRFRDSGGGGPHTRRKGDARGAGLRRRVRSASMDFQRLITTGISNISRQVSTMTAENHSALQYYNAKTGKYELNNADIYNLDDGEESEEEGAEDVVEEEPGSSCEHSAESSYDEIDPGLIIPPKIEAQSSRNLIQASRRTSHTDIRKLVRGAVNTQSTLHHEDFHGLEETLPWERIGLDDYATSELNTHEYKESVRALFAERVDIVQTPIFQLNHSPFVVPQGTPVQHVYILFELVKARNIFVLKRDEFIGTINRKKLFETLKTKVKFN